MFDISDNTRYWEHAQKSSFTLNQQVDFTETLLFQSANRTKTGALKGSFKLSDAQSTFRFTANSIDATGRIGY